MSTEAFVVFNFMFTCVLAFFMYRQHVVGGYENIRKIEELHQEIRNQAESFDRRLETTDDAIWRNIDQLHETVYKIQDTQPKKNTKGLNSRIPF